MSEEWTWRHKFSFWWKRFVGWFVDRPYKAGRVLAGRYEIVRVLGIGGYGITYLCRDLATAGAGHAKTPNAEVVVKQVKPTRRHGGKGRPIFDYETDMLAALHHPGIPQLLGKFEEDGHLFFAMEYMQGRNFEDLIFDEGRRYGEKEALLIMRELLDLVHFLHKQGIVHRDVRIPNVILADDRLRLIDFGLARRIGDSPTMIADELDDYFEEKKIRREVSFTSDYYAMGHFLLFLLYSSYQEEKGEVERTWEEELDLSTPTRHLLRRLLIIDDPFVDDQEVEEALEHALRGFLVEN